MLLFCDFLQALAVGSCRPVRVQFATLEVRDRQLMWADELRTNIEDAFRQPARIAAAPQCSQSCDLQSRTGTAEDAQPGRPCGHLTTSAATPPKPVPIRSPRPHRTERLNLDKLGRAVLVKMWAFPCHRPSSPTS